MPSEVDTTNSREHQRDKAHTTTSVTNPKLYIIFGVITTTLTLVKLRTSRYHGYSSYLGPLRPTPSSSTMKPIRRKALIKQMTMPFMAFCTALVVATFAHTSMKYARVNAGYDRDRKQAQMNEQRKALGMDEANSKSRFG